MVIDTLDIEYIILHLI